MREFTLSNDWYACDLKMFKKKNIVLKFSYEDYRNYILYSRDYKNKRDGGWRL